MKPLPQELIDIVVEFVPDNESLLACALAATSFVNASQRQLFHMVSIRTIPEYERASSANLLIWADMSDSWFC